MVKIQIHSLYVETYRNFNDFNVGNSDFKKFKVSTSLDLLKLFF